MLNAYCQRLEANDGTLSILNLHNVTLGNRGAARLGTALEKNGGVVVVIFGDNAAVGTSGATALARGLAQQTRLQYLYLSYNEMGTAGANAMAEHLFLSSNNNNNSSSVKVLHLAYNHIAAPETLLQCLSSSSSCCCCCRLEKLDLDGNNMSADFLVQLAVSLQTNHHLKSLHIQGNLKKASQAERIKVQSSFLQLLREHNRTLQDLKLDRLGSASSNSASALTTTSPEDLQELEVCRQLDYYTTLNRLGRHAFGEASVPATAWTRVLGKAARSSDPNILFSLLQARPDLAVQGR